MFLEILVRTCDYFGPDILFKKQKHLCSLCDWLKECGSHHTGNWGWLQGVQPGQYLGALGSEASWACFHVLPLPS